jgi:chromate reductase, NAD(P)H dehydrogenase (quinone)
VSKPDEASEGPFAVAVIVGSLRKDSYSRKVANALIELDNKALQLSVVDIHNLALFNQDEEENPPEAWTQFQARVRAADAVLFVTPEYNRSVPAALKNAIDVGSRPPGKNQWNRLPAGIVSVTPYALGGFGANHHLRQALVYLNMPTMQQPEAYISNVDKLFDSGGKLTSAPTREFFTKFLAAFAAWIAANRRQRSATAN